MSPSDNSYDFSRVERYALKAARQSASVPRTSFEMFQDSTRGRFLKRTTRELVRTTLNGWVLIVDREEGLVTVKKYSDIWGWERGRLLMLRTDGTLMRARYECHLILRDSSSANGVSTAVNELTVADARAVASFDRINRYNYRETRKHSGEIRRHELGRRFDTKYPHTAMETTLALKRLLENREYVTSLSINW